MSKRPGDNNAEQEQPAAKAVRTTPRVEVPLKHLEHVVRGRATDPEPIDLAWVRPWLGAGDNCFRCKMCDAYCDVGYEVEFQWGDTERSTYTDEMCGTCLSDVCLASRNAKNSKYVQAPPAAPAPVPVPRPVLILEAASDISRSVWLPETCLDDRVRAAVHSALAGRNDTSVAVTAFLWDPDSFETDDEQMRAWLPEALRAVHPREWGKMGNIYDYFDTVVELTR